MKKISLLVSMLLMLCGASAQNVYWVFLADKAGTTFDPYTYFDQKALERYDECGADLYDVSNYPLAGSYVAGVNALSIEEVGQSRWMNAMGVVATPAQATAIEQLPYVTHVELIGGDMQLAWKPEYSEYSGYSDNTNPVDTTLADQLLRMQGHLFRQAGIDGKGIRIAVFDGGFPKVNTHEAFKHLRDGKRILKTWNFPNHKEDVYGWNGHGTMTLSCIAGRMNGKDLGLATGAEFLLARTEVEPEPFKEEVWWMQAVEWADKNGANIISSSLGYGKDRYYTKDINGRSYVARAANLAARKGMLVVNSAGNEGDDKTWQYIITPSDADSVLCVGGITHSLTDYDHIEFSSFGPSADGRQKPNVCAFGHAWAANPHGKGGYQMVYGTSFSCPLVAGFAACAWQASKGKTNMELFDLIQRSGDLYPYCDYAFGYGVPQASFFCQTGGKNPASPTFRFEAQGPTRVSIIPLQADTNVHIFYKDIDDKGNIVMYGKRTLSQFDTSTSVDIEGGHHLVVFMKGYMADYRFDQPTNVKDKNNWVYVRSNDPRSSYITSNSLVRAPKQDVARESHHDWDYYFMLGVPVSMGELSARFWSPAKRLGIRWQYKFSKSYGIGLGLEYGHVSYRYNKRQPNELEQLIGLDNVINASDKVSRRKLNVGDWNLELFQRVRFMPGGQMHKGLHWDLGVYVGYSFNNYRLAYSNSNDPIAESRSLRLTTLSPLADQRLVYGVTTRLAYDIFGLYARYRLSGIGQPVSAGHVVLPRLEAGLQLLF